jgi:hypothetical protein
MAASARDPLQPLYLAIFLAATPLACVAVYGFGADRAAAALCNGCAFSAAFWLLFLSPLVNPFVVVTPRAAGSAFRARLRLATENWILWLTCFTQIAIQIPHNLFPAFLHRHRGGVVEWAFFAYGLSDRRWSEYTPDGGKTFALADEVQLINWNDGLLGIVVLLAFLHWRSSNTTKKKGNNTGYSKGASVALALAVVFRDATLWRETVEYLGQHYYSSHAFTTDDPAHRTVAIYLVYAINGLWIIAPMLSPLWAWHLIDDAFSEPPAEKDD